MRKSCAHNSAQPIQIIAFHKQLKNAGLSMSRCTLKCQGVHKNFETHFKFSNRFELSIFLNVVWILNAYILTCHWIGTYFSNCLTGPTRLLAEPTYCTHPGNIDPQTDAATDHSCSFVFDLCNNNNLISCPRLPRHLSQEAVPLGILKDISMIESALPPSYQYLKQGQHGIYSARVQ